MSVPKWRVISRSPRNVIFPNFTCIYRKKNSATTPLPPQERGPLFEIKKNFCHYPPPRNVVCLRRSRENFCYYPPPPPNLVGCWRSRKMYRVAPPPKIMATHLPLLYTWCIKNMLINALYYSSNGILLCSYNNNNLTINLFFIYSGYNTYIKLF